MHKGWVHVGSGAVMFVCCLICSYVGARNVCSLGIFWVNFNRYFHWMRINSWLCFLSSCSKLCILARRSQRAPNWEKNPPPITMGMKWPRLIGFLPSAQLMWTRPNVWAMTTVVWLWGNASRNLAGHSMSVADHFWEASIHVLDMLTHS